LTAPGKDAEDFARVLQDKEICAFDQVNLLLNQPEHIVRGTIDEFFDQKKPDDLLVLYFSGHGVRDELGSLYLAVKNTIRTRLRSTAVKSDYIREAMDQSRSRRQVLILDCCNSGAFSQGTKAATGVSIGTASAFEAGYGRIILTASDSTQFAWEGDKVIGETDRSLFTHFLVEGLEGEADLDGDGQITVDELYDYAYERVRLATPKQSPSKFSNKQQGEIVLRQSMRLEDIKSIPLPAPILDSIENPFADIRLGAVQQLSKLLHGKNRGLARSAREALESISENDDSRQVSRAAAQALELARTQAGSPTIRLETEEAQAPVAHVAQKEEPAKPETDEAMLLSSRQALITLGWAIAGAISGVVYSLSDEVLSGTIVGIYYSFDGVFGGAIGGAIGGLITAHALRTENAGFNWKSMFWMSLAWAIGGAAGWVIGESNYEVRGMVIGLGIGAMISMAIIFSAGLFSFDWKSLAWIVLGWAIGGGIGWFIGKRLFVEQLSIDSGFGWAISIGIGWGIGGYVLGWQLLNNLSKKES
jgi:hypothetical protein